jgi:hypothetical protein
MAACSDWVEERGEVHYSHPRPAESPPRFSSSSFFSLGEGGSDKRGGLGAGDSAAQSRKGSRNKIVPASADNNLVWYLGLNLILWWYRPALCSYIDIVKMF